MPFGEYEDFDDCVRKNRDKDDPEAYCAVLEREILGKKAALAVEPGAGILPEAYRPAASPDVPEGRACGNCAYYDETDVREVDGALEVACTLWAAYVRGDHYCDAWEEAVEVEVVSPATVRGMRLEIVPVVDEPFVEEITPDLKDAIREIVKEILVEEEEAEVAAEAEEKRAETEREIAEEKAEAAEEKALIEDLGTGKKKRERPAMAVEAEGDTVGDDAVEIVTEGDLEDDVEDVVESDTEEPESFHSLLVVEGVWTGDGRYIEEEALGWRDLPLPLMAIDRTTEAHMNAVLIGRITRIERAGREIHGYGRLIESEDPDVQRLQNLVRRGELRGVSVDLDALEYEVLMTDAMPEPEIDADGNTAIAVEEMRMRVTSARIMGATVVPFPAFQEAFIESLAVLTASLETAPDVSGYIEDFASYEDVDFTPPKGAREEAARGLAWRDQYGRGGTEIGIARARDLSNGRRLSPDTINRMVSYFARHEVDKQGQGWSPEDDGYPSNGRIAWALWGGDAGRDWANKVKKQMDSRDARGSIVASGHLIEAPVVPPSAWFAKPAFDAPTPLTVSDDGRVYGHLAVWEQCHRGYADRCVQPPTSSTAYAHFLTGEILCDDGTRHPVGQITLNAGHAHHAASARDTAAHYDNTATAVADVIAGEDEFGIWLSGALRPGLDPALIRTLMASDVSGDWRRIGGHLELIAVLAVNVPGFPKVRVREVAGLVASLSLPAFDDLEARDLLLASAAERIAASIGRSRRDRVAALAARVRGQG